MQTKLFTPSKITLLCILFASMLTLLGGAAVAPALPLISSAFPQADETLISLIVTLPSLTVAVSGFAIGALADRIGKVKVLAASLLVFALGGVSACFLDSLSVILLGRVAVGLGIAGITSTTTSLIAGYYQGITRTRVLGYQTAAMGFGILVLEIGGGLLASISWRAAFLIYLLGAVALLGTVLSMREPTVHAAEKSTVQTEKIPAGKTALIYFSIFLAMMFFFLIPTKYPYHLQDIGVTSTILSGILLGFVGFISSILGVFYWKFAVRVPRFVLAAAGFVCLGIGFVIMGLSTTLPLQFAALTFLGFGNGLINPTMVTWLSAVVPQESMGKASGGYGAAINIGQFVSSLAAIPILAFAVSYGNMFAVFGGVAVLIGLCYLAAQIRAKKNFV